MAFTRPAHADRFNDSSATDGTTVIDALSDAIEALQVAGPASGIPVFNVASYGAIPGASAATNATGIQAAIDACAAVGGGIVWMPGSNTAYDYSTTLTMKQGIHLMSSATFGHWGGATLNFTGADGQHGITNTPDVSGMRLTGFYIKDGRTTPTGGDGIHIVQSTNGIEIGHVQSANFPGHGIYIGRSGANPTDNLYVHDCWLYSLGTTTYGLCLEYIDENIHLENLRGDMNNVASAAALVSLDNISSGVATALIETSCIETTQNRHVVRVGPNFNSQLVCIGVCFGTGTTDGGDVIHWESTGGNLVAIATGSPVTTFDSLIHDVPRSTTYGDGTGGGAYRQLTYFDLTNSGLGHIQAPAQTVVGVPVLASSMTNHGIFYDSNQRIMWSFDGTVPARGVLFG